MKSFKGIKPSLRRMKRDARGISPIVATLMLVLITVAAAVAFYMFETGWQKTATSNVGDGTVSSTQIKMAGSTTVTDLMNKMVPAFEQNNSGFKVSYTGSGSGAGLVAIESGTADIGMISDDMNAVTAGTTTTYPHLVSTTIAYDGVSIFIGSTAQTYHNIVSMNLNTTIIDAIYGVPGVTAVTTWQQLETTYSTAIVLGTGGDSHSADTIITHYRSDSSGTQDAFCDKALQSHKFLSAGHLSNAVGENGNPLMITDVMADKNGIGFATTGMVSTTAGALSAKWNGVAPTSTSVIDAVTNHGAASSQYLIWHPLNLVTNGQPTTDVKSFIDWCTSPDNNLALCNAAGFTSIYQSV